LEEGKRWEEHRRLRQAARPESLKLEILNGVE
jgi:hypothetical protein